MRRGDMDQGFVYHWRGDAQVLRKIARQVLGDEAFCWVADAPRLEVLSGIPDDLKDQGALFNMRGEIRWQRRGDEYEAVFLMDEPISVSCEQVNGEWRSKELKVFLQSLEERQVDPQFEVYPHGASEGRLLGRIFYRDGICLFTSPRRFEPDEEGEK